MSSISPIVNLAESAEVAEARFKQFESVDPFPNIPPALLNSGDIYDYARITGMVWPFEKQKLKSASYEVPFIGDVYFIDKDGVRQHRTVQENSIFELEKNSIAFVFLATTFRLPDYMAVRFNLKITHVHRGLLLGTGPLVDPGFAGRLLVPLHNLTSERYILHGGHGLIWMEFTKLSPHRKWSQKARKDSGDYVPFPKEKRYLVAEKYFEKASDGIPAASSIPGEVKGATKSAEEAKSTVEGLRKKIRDYAFVGGFLGGLTLVIGIISALVPTWGLISDANNSVANAAITVSNLRDEHMRYQRRLDDLEAELKHLRPSADPVEKQSSTTQQKVDRVDLHPKVSSHPVSGKSPATIPKARN